MITVERSRPWHLHSVNTDSQIHDFQIMDPTAMRIMHLSGPSYTMMEDGLPILIGGIIILWAGVGEVWAVVTRRAAEIPITTHRTSVRYLEIMSREAGIVRAQCVVRSDFETGKRWVKSLGFRLEGLLRKYGKSGEDYLRYARIY